MLESSMRALAIYLFAFALLSTAIPRFAHPTRDADSDRKALVALEDGWLHARDAGTLDRILADDFVHPVAPGLFLSKTDTSIGSQNIFHPRAARPGSIIYECDSTATRQS
jgi:hypothetical protein